MQLNINKTNKNILIGLAAATTVTTIALVSHKAAKKKREVVNSHKDEEFSELIDDLECISDKIVAMAQTQEQLDKLSKEKALLKENFILKPY